LEQSVKDNIQMDLEGSLWRCEVGNWKQELHKVLWDGARKSQDEVEG
jgi:hypothetical protein